MTEPSDLMKQLCQVALQNQAACSSVSEINGGEQVKITCEHTTVTVSLYSKRGNGQVQPPGLIEWVDLWVEALPKQGSTRKSTDARNQQHNYSIWAPADPGYRAQWIQKVQDLVPAGIWDEDEREILRASQLTITLRKNKLQFQGHHPDTLKISDELVAFHEGLILADIRNMEVLENSISIADDWNRFCGDLESSGFELLKTQNQVARKAIGDDRFEIRTPAGIAIAQFRAQGTSYLLENCIADHEEEIRAIYYRRSSEESGQLLAYPKNDQLNNYTWVIAVHPQLFRWLESRSAGCVDMKTYHPMLMEQKLCSECLSSTEPLPTEKGNGWIAIRKMWEADIDRLESDPTNPISEVQSCHIGVPDKTGSTRSQSTLVPEKMDKRYSVHYIENGENSGLRSVLEMLPDLK